MLLAFIFAKSKPLQMQGIELLKSIVLINVMNIFSAEDLIPELTEARIVNVVFITLFVYASIHAFFKIILSLNLINKDTLTIGMISVNEVIANDETLILESDKSFE